MSPQDRVSAALKTLGLPGELTEMHTSTSTSEDAAKACECALGQIVKTLVFVADGRPTLVLAAGDRQVDTGLLAQLVGVGRKKLRMGTPEEVLAQTGFPVGGVSPVGLANPSDVVVDDSLKRFDDVWAAAGTTNSVFPVRITDLVAAVGGQWATITRETA